MHWGDSQRGDHQGLLIHDVASASHWGFALGFHHTHMHMYVYTYAYTHTFTYTYDIHICSHCSKMMIIHDHHYHQLSFHRTRLGSNLSAAVAAFIVRRSGFGLPVSWRVVASRLGWITWRVHLVVSRLRNNRTFNAN